MRHLWGYTHVISDILNMFRTQEPPDELSDEDGRCALAALMVRAARADDHYLREERDIIEHTLSERYGLSEADARQLRVEAEHVEAEAPDTVRFTRVIKQVVPYEDRMAVAEALWTVVLADDHRDAEEDGFLRLVVNLIGVADRDSGIARQRTKARMT